MAVQVNLGNRGAGKTVDPNQLADQQRSIYEANEARRNVDNTAYIGGDALSMAEAVRQAAPSVPVTQGRMGTTTDGVVNLGEGSDLTNQVLGAVNPDLLNLDPSVVKAMEDVGLISPKGGITYDPEVEQRGQIAAFTNRTPEDLIESGIMPVGAGALQQRNMDGSYQAIPKPEAVNQIDWLQKNAQELNSTLMNASIDKNTGTLTELGQIISNELGRGAVARPEVGMNALLGYYRAMEEASYADYSQEEKQGHADFRKETDEVHPDLWETRKGKPAMTPQRNVLEQEVGRHIEEVSGIKFSSREKRDIVGQSVVRAMQQMGPEASLFLDETTYAGPSGTSMMPTPGMYPVKGMDIDTILRRNRLGLTKGIRDLLQPNHRNNVRVTPLNKKRDPNSQLSGKKQSGVSPFRTEASNIIEEMPMMLDQQFLNIFRVTWSDPAWVEFWEGHAAKHKQEHLNIVLQQDAHIKKNSPDGKTYYTDLVQRDSGRKGDKNLLMADIKLARFASIARHESTTINLKKDEYTSEEKDLISAMMANLGADDLVFGPTLAQFEEQFKDPSSEARKVASMVSALAKDGQMPEGLTPERLRPFMHESGDSVQALRAIDAYMKAKEGKQKKFMTKFVGEVDASQSGQTIQSMQIGNVDAFLRGGGHSPVFMERMSQDLKLELPKLYTDTTKLAHSKFTGIILEDIELGEFASLLFGDMNNLFNKDFAKTGIQGASYGQGKPGAMKAIRTKMTEWVEGGSSQEIVAKAAAINAFLGGDVVEVVHPKGGQGRQAVLGNSGGVKVVFKDAALEHMDKIAVIFRNAMYDSDPLILKYSSRMRKMFKVYAKLSAFSEANGQDFGSPEMFYMEPMDLNNPYKGKWGVGMKTDMIDKHIPTEYTSIPFLGSDEHGNTSVDWDEGDIHYQKGKPQHDLAGELDALDFNTDTRSKGVTRFPVISIHGLDDLAISIAVVQMKKNHPETFTYFMSVWDAGRLPPLLRRQFAQEYNKALKEVVKNNRFFENLAISFENFIGEGKLPKDLEAKLNANPDTQDELRKLRKDTQSIVNMAKGFRKKKLGTFDKGRDESYKSPNVGRKGAAGTTLIDEYMDDYGFTNMDAGTEGPSFFEASITTPRQKASAKEELMKKTGADMMAGLLDLG